MFSLFRSRREGATIVVPGEHDFFLRLERIKTNRSVFESQGEIHGETDLRLVQKVEDLLVPLLGRWEQSDTWFHQMDYYGDGVRSLTFRRDVFPRSSVPALQALLSGDHQPFTILCTVVDQFQSSYDDRLKVRQDDYLALFSNKLLVTKALANELSIDA